MCALHNRPGPVWARVGRLECLPLSGTVERIGAPFPALCKKWSADPYESYQFSPTSFLLSALGA